MALAVARRCGTRLDDLALLSAWGCPCTVAVPDSVPADPWLLGSALEVLLSDVDRRRRGAHFTDRAVAATVVDLALADVAVDRSTTVCDPAVGGGAFLLAAASALNGAGVPRQTAIRSLGGVDVDPLAVAVAEAASNLWAGGRGTADLEVADALAQPPASWGRPTLVVGNPPFLAQRRSATARPPDRSGLREDLAALAGPYTDTSALFAALATGMVAPGGRVALVLPRSFLVARDAGAARAATLDAASLAHVWLPGRRLFGAAVDVCVPVWRSHPPRVGAAPDARGSAGTGRRGERDVRPEGASPGPGRPGERHVVAALRGADVRVGSRRGTWGPDEDADDARRRREEDGVTPVRPSDAPTAVARSVGVPLVEASPVAPPEGGGSWSNLLAGLAGEPVVPSLAGLATTGVLGDLCTATAGFRDQFYGLIPFVVDDPGGDLEDDTHAPLVTSGLIGHAVSDWATRSARYAGRRWEAPRIDIAAVMAAGGALARWTEGKRVPKLLVAAQTRTIEAVADVDGTWLPSTPVATVVPAPGMHWHVLAVLLSPVASAWALQANRGSGLSPNAIRLPPAALRAIPTPAHQAPWGEAAAAVCAASQAADPSTRSALLGVAAASTCDAYGIDADPAVAWWAARLPAA